MADSTSQKPTEPAAKSGGSSAPGSTKAGVERHGGSGGGALHTDHGTTTIASSVVAKIASLSAQEIPGVRALGKSVSRTIGSLRAKVPGASQAATQGVSVEVGERQAAIDVDIVVYYGQSIVETAEAIRHNIIERIEGMTGLEVVEVNVAVDDLYFDGDDDGDQGSRVS